MVGVWRGRQRWQGGGGHRSPAAVPSPLSLRSQRPRRRRQRRASQPPQSSPGGRRCGPHGPLVRSALVEERRPEDELASRGEAERARERARRSDPQGQRGTPDGEEEGLGDRASSEAWGAAVEHCLGEAGKASRRRRSGSRRRRSRSRGGGRGRERRSVETWFRIDGLRFLFAKGRRCSTVSASHAKRTVGRARAAVSEQRGTASERRGRRREKKEAKKTRMLISFSIERRARK